ncbi:MAG: glycoside hydrolase family 2 [Mucilaginibacter sp.]|nr:glycoside hydrolase family 2 [Mucilaginibacter sp.]
MKKFLTLAICALLPSLLFAQQWQPKKAALMSKFAKDVNPNSVLPEYPRPQMVRAKWMNLNGLWQYQPGAAGDVLPTGKLSSNILVPFAVESALSGVMEAHDRLWYRRTFTVPATWKGENILLHFGAVDFESEVFVNGKSVGVHKGGYDPFSYDITSAITASGPQEITVRVFDPTDNGGFPRGKQTLKPGGIMYQSVTGIWQTVWLEPVPKAGINDIKIVPDIDKGVVKLTVTADGAANLSITVKDGAKVVKTMTAKANTEISVPVPNAKLWSPDSPFLYDLEIAVVKGATKVDAVSSYFGMRKISVENDGGYKKLYLNNKFLFQVGPLDQGFWPDGGYTAPTDAALKYDIQKTKDFGFNMIRKHIKVEPYRWYYWADKLGLMIWQDMPSPNSYVGRGFTAQPVDTAEFRSELARIVQTHWNSPCIVTWVTFNEGQSQRAQNTPSLVSMVKQMDPSRLVNQASGGEWYNAGDYLDVHSYPDPDALPSTTQVVANGEYGGIGYIIPGHTWSQRPTYIMIDKLKDYTDLYHSYSRDLAFLKTTRGLSAAVYTETTDVESELNGLLTYDREVVKAPEATIKASNDLAIKGSVTLTTVLPTSQMEGRNWKYTFEKPDTAWLTPAFNDGAWQSAVAGFSSRIGNNIRANATPNLVRPTPTPTGVRTIWTGKDIWMRQEFTAGSVASIKDLVLVIRHQDNCDVYINGVKAASIAGHSRNYTIEDINDAGKKAFVPNGKNAIAIHAHIDAGNNRAGFIDAGISVVNIK